MEYQTPPQPDGNRKRIVIIASLAMVGIAALVLVILLIRNASLQPESEVIGTGAVNEEAAESDDVASPPLSTSGAAESGTEVSATIVENPTGALPPNQPSNAELSAPLQPGASRLLTTEEKTRYGFDVSANIWIVTSSPTDGSRPVASFEDRSSGAANFPPDADNDGLSDAEEGRLGTDPKKVDTDGDGTTDGDEAYTYKTDPLKPDTDGDGVTDHDEAENGTDPLKP